MQDGTTLTVTDVDCTALLENSILLDALHIRRIISRAKSVTKVIVSHRWRCISHCSYIKYVLFTQIGAKEIECDPNFTLQLVSSDLLPFIPSAIATLTSIVVFQPEREGIAELLLDSFLTLQNPKTSHDRKQLREEIHHQAEQLLTVESELLQLLAVGDSTQVEDPKVTKAILLQNKAYNDAQEG